MARETTLDSRRHWVAWGVVAVLGVAAVFALGPRLLDPAIWPAEDYVVFWGAGRLHLEGDNPYDLDRMHAIQRQHGSDRPYALPMYNPPWALPFLMPFSLFDFPASRALWLLFGVATFLISIGVLANFYKLPESKRFVAWCVCFTFLPTLLLLRMGQLTLFPLLGLVGFLYFQERKQSFWAGAALVLTAVKPHLVALVLVAVLLWALWERRWLLLASGAGLGAMLIALPFLWSPGVYQNYSAFLSQSPPSFLAPTVGALLKHYVAEPRWISFVPVVAGVIWVGAHFWRNRNGWDWGREMPLLALVSLLVCPYGWSYDLALVIIPLIGTLAALALANQEMRFRLVVGLFLTINVAMWVMNAVVKVPEHYYVWVVPVLLAGYVVSARSASKGWETAMG
jgi:hypothetical protein